LLKQVSAQLRARELIKLKLQKSALAETQTRLVAEKVAAATGSVIVDVTGHTFTLYKRSEVTRSEKKH